MSPKNERDNAMAELDRARESLSAARVLAGAGLHADSVSDAYYAIFHAVRALLFTLGLEPKSHGGALHLFNQHFVRTGRLGAEHLSLVAQAQQDRTIADYELNPRFTREEVDQTIEAALAFVGTAAELVRSSTSPSN